MVNALAANSLGMLFIGFTLATWLFGANTLQTYVYFQRYNDGYLLKAVVVVVFLSDLLNTIFTCWGIYMELVQTPILPLQGNVPLVLESTASDVIIFIVQCFFAQTIYQMSQHNKWLTGLILSLATLAFASGIALTGSSITSLYLAGKQLPLLNEIFFALALGLVTLTDIVITVSLVRYLFDGKSSTGLQISNLVDSLIIYCVQRGILTTASHAIVLVLWFSLPPTEWVWTVFQFGLGKVYMFTFLTLLNRRKGLQRLNEHTNDPSVLEFHLSTRGLSMVAHDDGTEEATKSVMPSDV